MPNRPDSPLSRRIKALAAFGTFAFRQTKLQPILDESARVCAECMGVPFSKICMYRPEENNLIVVAGHGWNAGVVGFAISVADESSPQGRAFSTGEPQLCSNIDDTNTYTLPEFYLDHKVLSTVDIVVAAKGNGVPFGVLELDSPKAGVFNDEDIDFLTGFANIMAEAVATVARAEELHNALIRMEQLVEEKETLSQELKHRVRNSLHLVYGLLTLEIKGKHDKASEEAFRSIALRVMGLAQVFDHLLGVGMNSIIDFDQYVQALCRNLPALYRLDDIKLKCETEPLRINLDNATALGIIITELINNAYLHAFPDDRGEISVDLNHHHDDDSRPTLTISDTGVGFAEIETKRHGMALVRRLIKQIEGTITHTSDHGTEWVITLPALVVM